jgi:hypothetical protein
MMPIRSLAILFLSIAMLVETQAQSFIYPGEDLTYRVSYAGITLGTVRALTEPYTTFNGRNVAKVKVFINSNPNIPFVSLHSVYQSWMDTSATFSVNFNATTQIEDNLWEFDQYLFDYTNMNLTMETYREKKLTKKREIGIKKYCNDGSSILYAARALINSKKTIKLPTVIMGDTATTVVNFRGTKQATDIDAVKYPVSTVYFDGTANWTGVYGLTGGFEGWFSDDAARVPIKAKMKVYIGSVTLELQSWKRGNWQPPKAG